MRSAVPVLAPTLLALAVGAACLAALFHTEVAAALHVWATSTAFGHCALVLPIALYLAYDRRDALAALIAAGERPHPTPSAVLLIVPLALAWFASERLGIMEFRQFAALSMAQVLAFGVLGPRVWRVLAVPLLYLYFLVPFGAFVTPVLQGFTARFIDVGLSVLQIPHVVTADIIEIPAGAFRVAEACAGLRFLIASIAFGVLYAVTLYRGTGRRIAFVAASIVVPIIANGFRALGIVVLGQILGDAEAAAVDHLVYGWLFFTLVTLLLILGGLPFRQDRGVRAPVRSSRPHGTVPSPVPTLLAAVLLAAAAPAVSASLDRGAGSQPFTPALILPAGCTRLVASGPIQHVACAGVRITVQAISFDPRSGPQMILATQRRLAGPGEVLASMSVPSAGHTWQLAETTEPASIHALGVWLNAAGSSTTGLAWRLQQARASTLPANPGQWHPLMAFAAVENPSAPNAAEALRSFIALQRL